MDDGSAGEDFRDISPMRNQPGRQAKLRKTSQSTPKHALIGPRHHHRNSTSFSASSRDNSWDGSPDRGKPFTATPGIDGVPPMPRADREKKDNAIPEEDEDEKGHEHGHGNSEFEWPDECF